MFRRMMRRFFRPVRPAGSIARNHKPVLQLLEEKAVPAVFIVSKTSDGPVSGSGDQPGTLRQAIFDANALIGADTVQFDSSFSSFQTIALSAGQLKITESLNIQGPAKSVAISGKNPDRVLEIASAGTVDLSNLVIQNGVVTGKSGGGILSTSTNLKLTQCTVTLNISTDSNGGGIFASLGSLTLIDTTVSKNSAGNNGGGIYADSSQLTFDRTDTKSPGCLIEQNTASSSGGGIYQVGSSLTTKHSTITLNTANGNHGGAVYAQGVNVTVSDVTVSKNKAIGNEGGGLRLGICTTTVTNSKLLENTCLFFGGGIYHHTGSLSISNSEVSGNVTSSALSGLGGGIYTIYGKVDLTNCLVSSNTTTVGRGGGIYASTIDVTITGSTLTNNFVGSGGPLGFGGAIYFNGNLPEMDKNLTISSSTISLNEAQGYGGGVFVRYGDSVLFQKCLLDQNEAGSGGGAMYMDTASSSTAKLTESKLTGNTSGSEGAGMLVYGSGGLTIEKSTISGNETGGTGGGMVIRSFTLDMKVTIDTCTIENNEAGGNAGGIAMDNIPLTLIKNSLIASNIATSGFGGGLFYPNSANDNKTYHVENSTIAFNKAVQGGGVYFNGLGDFFFSDALNFYNCTIASNEATGDPNAIPPIPAFGGGIYLTGMVNDGFSISGILLLDSTIVANNIASAGGNDIFDDVNSGSDGLVQDPFGLIEDVTGFKLGNSPSNQNTSDPGLDPAGLANNGGPTRTIRLQFTSPAIDTGRNDQLSPQLSFDQRGMGFERVVLGKIDSLNNPMNQPRADIGAFELQAVSVLSVECWGGTNSKTVTDNSIDYTKNHSRVTHLEVTFDQPVTLPTNPADAFTLTQKTGLITGKVTFASATPVGNTKIVFTFADHTEGEGSLIDGLYELIINATQVKSTNGVFLDGNGDGKVGDNFVSPTPTFDPLNLNLPPNIVYRLFGDGWLTGNRIVTSDDFNAFRMVFGIPDSVFDFNGNGTVDSDDFNAFRARFGTFI